MTIKHKISGLEFKSYGTVLVGDNPNNIGFVVFIEDGKFLNSEGELQANQPNTIDGITQPTGWTVVRASEFLPVTTITTRS